MAGPRGCHCCRGRAGLGRQYRMEGRALIIKGKRMAGAAHPWVYNALEVQAAKSSC